MARTWGLNLDLKQRLGRTARPLPPCLGGSGACVHTRSSQRFLRESTHVWSFRHACLCAATSDFESNTQDQRL